MDLGQGAATLVLRCQQCRQRLSVAGSTVRVHSDCRVCGCLFYPSRGTGPYLPQLARGQSCNTWLMCRAYHMWFPTWISQLPSWLTHCIGRQTHKLCPGTLMMYIDIPICLSSISVCILAKIGKHLQTNGNALKDSGLPFSLHKTNSKHSSQAKENHYLTLKIFIVFS